MTGRHALTPLGMFLVALMCVLALVLAGCSSFHRIGSNCRTHGGLWAVRIQSINTVVFICRDGDVFRWDKNQ